MLWLETIQLMEDGEIERAAALAVQCAKANHQACLNYGRWETAWTYTGLADPLSRKRWAGTPAELEAAADLVDAMEKLEGRAKGKKLLDVSGDESTKTEKDKKKKEGKGTGKDTGKDKGGKAE